VGSTTQWLGRQTLTKGEVPNSLTRGMGAKWSDKLELWAIERLTHLNV